MARKEICICAAVKSENGVVMRGQRHCDCFKALRDRKLKRMLSSDGIGFITSYNRYVGREEAFKLQYEAGIGSVAEGGFRGKVLYNEDLY